MGSRFDCCRLFFLDCRWLSVFECGRLFMFNGRRFFLFDCSWLWFFNGGWIFFLQCCQILFFLFYKMCIRDRNISLYCTVSFCRCQQRQKLPALFPSIPTKTLLFSVLNFPFSAKDSTFLQFNQKKSKSVLTVG